MRKDLMKYVLITISTTIITFLVCVSLYYIIESSMERKAENRNSTQVAEQHNANEYSEDVVQMELHSENTVSVEADIISEQEIDDKEGFVQYDGKEIGTHLEGIYDGWQEAYCSYVMKNDISNYYDSDEYRGYYTYSLIYLDDDDIPELFIEGDCEASGEMILTYYDNSISILQLGRIGTLYIEHSGLLYSNNGHMDYYPASIVQLRDGLFYLVESGVSGGLDWTEGPMIDADGCPIYQYEWEGERMTEEEYYGKINAIFDIDRGKRPDEKFMYMEMISYLKTGGCISQDHRYEIVMANLTWQEAQEICKKKGGYLATITSPLELENLEKQIKSENMEEGVFYVGYRTCEWVGDTFCDYRWIGKNGNIIPAECMMPSYSDKLFSDSTCGIVAMSEGALKVFGAPEDIIRNAPRYKGKIGYICEYE